MSMSWGWARGEPNGWLGMENFVEWRFGDVYGFNDVGADRKNAFICEQDSEATPIDPNPGKRPTPRRFEKQSREKKNTK